MSIKYIIDLRNSVLTEECEHYLAHLISKSCEPDSLKLKMSLIAKENCGWNTGKLVGYVVKGVMTPFTTRINSNISSGEWMCSILCSGQHLSAVHLKIVMCFVNPYMLYHSMSCGSYISGKEGWRDAPEPLKNILDMLDDVAVNSESVYVIIPVIYPNYNLTIEELEQMPAGIVKEMCTIVWKYVTV
ncbi:MAG TPA: hypothetical protein VLE02_01785 [Nitrosarchaeum sp.]|nr:hypothetical protein [Nitrosarchaeum sp.]